MLRIDTGPSPGLKFKDYCDALITSPDQSTITDWHKDIKGKYWEDDDKCVQECFWLDYLAQYRQCMKDYDPVFGSSVPNVYSPPPTDIPEPIKNSRGIGNWNNPKYIIVSESVSSTSQMTDRWDYWEHLPRYRRIRPFNSNAKELYFFYRLLGGNAVSVPQQTWITCAGKNWLPPGVRGSTLWKEFNYLLSLNVTKIIVCLGMGACDLLCSTLSDPGDKRIQILQNPTFYGKSHSWEWQQYRKQFVDFLEGKAPPPEA